jgi:hypothetical protein
MKKIFGLFVVSFLFFSVPATTKAVSGCCSYHGGVCGWTCCDGAEVPVWSPACENAPKDYYNNLIGMCEDIITEYENEVRKNKTLGALYFGGRGVSEGSTAESFGIKAQEYLEKIESQKVTCEKFNMEYLTGYILKYYNKAIKDGTELNLKINTEKISDPKNISFLNEIKAGINPCHRGYVPYKGACEEESKICLDVEHGYYDWKKGNCMCDQGYYWENIQNKCVVIPVVVHECSEGFSWNESSESCLQDCGLNTYESGDQCLCKTGYTWKDDSSLSCVKIKTTSTKTETISTTQTETTSKKYTLDELKFKKIDDFKVLAKKTPKGIILMLWKPENSVASQIKSYEYSLTDKNGEKQAVILHKKKLLLFKPKTGMSYNLHIFGKDESGNIVAEAEFLMEQ